MTKIAFSVPGVPSAKGRPRATARIVIVDGKPTAIVSMHTPKETVAAEKAIRNLFEFRFPKHQLLTRAVMIKFVAVFPIPPSWPKAVREAAARGTLYHTSKPDKDNVEKLIVDALNGVAWADDAQVQGGGVKRYGSPPRLEITIEAIDQPDVPATPGQRRTEARVAAGEPTQRQRPLRGKPTKSKYPPALRAAIDAALNRDKGTPA